jgi:hypothetical protein
MGCSQYISWCAACLHSTLTALCIMLQPICTPSLAQLVADGIIAGGMIPK